MRDDTTADADVAAQRATADVEAHVEAQRAAAEAQRDAVTRAVQAVAAHPGLPLATRIALAVAAADHALGGTHDTWITQP